MDQSWFGFSSRSVLVIGMFFHVQGPWKGMKKYFEILE